MTNIKINSNDLLNNSDMKLYMDQIVVILLDAIDEDIKYYQKSNSYVNDH